MLTPIGAFVQRHDPERFTTALFAPADVRETLFTLYALNHELARARAATREPMLALIRLQWWREVIEGAQRTHEVATPLMAALAEHRLQPQSLLRMVQARALETEDSVTVAELDAYLHDGAGAMMREAGRVLCAGADLPALERLGAGVGAAGLLRNRAACLRAGRWWTADGMTQADTTALAHDLLGPVQRWPEATRPAALPAVIARRFLRRSGVWRPSMWLAANTGRI